MKKQWYVIPLIAAMTLGLFAGCGNDLPAVYVQSVADIVGYGSLGQTTVCGGVVVAGNEVDVRKDENRTVAELRVQVGQTVAEGDVLFVYDTEEIRLSLDKAALEIEQLKNSVSDLQSQIARLETEKASAPSSEQLSYTVQIQSLQADKRETEYNITVKERELEAMKAVDTSGEVRATVAGKIKTINENGGYDNYTGQELPFMTVVEEGAYRVKGRIDELNRDSFRVGMQVLLRSRADETQTWSGVIETVDTNPEESNNSGIYYTYDTAGSDMSASNYPFYVVLDDVTGLVLGQHVYIEPADSAQRDGLWLDASFVVEEDGTHYVWAADGNDELEKRAVTVGEFDEEFYRYEIVSGLAFEDRIAFPEESLRAGAPVTGEAPEPVEGGDGTVFDGNDNGVFDGGAVDGENFGAIAENDDRPESSESSEG